MSRTGGGDAVIRDRALVDGERGVEGVNPAASWPRGRRSGARVDARVRLVVVDGAARDVEGSAWEPDPAAVAHRGSCAAGYGVGIVVPDRRAGQGEGPA